jgi:hypothetical protein
MEEIMKRPIAALALAVASLFAAGGCESPVSADVLDERAAELSTPLVEDLASLEEVAEATCDTYCCAVCTRCTQCPSFTCVECQQCGQHCAE